MLRFLDKLFTTPTQGFGLAMATAMSASPLAQRAVTQQSTAQVVEEIHNAFNTAGDRLLQEAQDILAQNDESSFAKAERLGELGFSQARGVQEVADKRRQVAISSTLQSILLEYSVKYPTYRFIDLEGICAICLKYNLVFGCASDYTGFVPEKNLAEIEKAPWKPVLREQQRTRASGRAVPYGPWEDKAGSDMEAYISKEPGYVFTGNSYRGSIVEWQFRKASSFFICAPVKDMDMQGKRLEGHTIVNLEIPDPVVLHPMGNGLYAILTAWGNESSDPLVVKENLN